VAGPLPCARNSPNVSPHHLDVLKDLLRSAVLVSIVGVLLTAALICFACGGEGRTQRPTDKTSLASRLLPGPERLAAAPADLRQRMALTPLAFFRFVNQAWMHEVCEAFAPDLRALPAVRLHGDAHVEQYAVTDTARGLDDFDDSARGPAVFDIVRFIGSLELTTRERGWEASRAAIIDDFFNGYRRALMDPSYLPSDPIVVTRLRMKSGMSTVEYLQWVDSLMEPLPTQETARVNATWEQIAALVTRTNPEFTSSFLTRKKMGMLHLGIGSALDRKILIHIEGATTAPDDDVVLEAKELSPMRPERCISVPPSAEVYRIVEGLNQIGRIRHRMVLAIPALADAAPEQRGWWVKTWDRAYRELHIADLASADELREVAHDVGAQLGSSNLLETPKGLSQQKRLVELNAVKLLEPKIRKVSDNLTLAVLEAWEHFRTITRADGVRF